MLSLSLKLRYSLDHRAHTLKLCCECVSAELTQITQWHTRSRTQGSIVHMSSVKHFKNTLTVMLDRVYQRRWLTVCVSGSSERQLLACQLSHPPPVDTLMHSLFSLWHWEEAPPRSCASATAMVVVNPLSKTELKEQSTTCSEKLISLQSLCQTPYNFEGPHY